MAERAADVLLIGGGVASASCAVALREGGFDGSILLCGREPDPPYSRPPASKGYLRGEEGLADALFRPAEWYAEHDVELLTRVSVMKLDPAARTAKLSTKDEVGFGQALLATGANVRRLRAEGADLDGIHYLRALRNADTLREDVEDAERVVLVGGSYIGCEVAATLTAMGKRCAIVMQEPTTLCTGFGEQAGAHFARLLASHGVEVHGGEEVVRFEGTAGEGDEPGRVERVVCASGLVVEGDAVVVGAGAMPDVMLARSSGLELGELGGVRCDERLRTSVEGIFAAGDMCEYRSVHHDRHVRIEHWDVAVEHGRTVAANMLGEDRPHETVPYFWCDLADWASLEYVGPALDGWDEEVVRGSTGDGAFTVWYLREGRLAAALAAGPPQDAERRGRDLDAARRLLAARADLTGAHAALRDPAADLTTLA